jgi:hypothetical protein
VNEEASHYVRLFDGNKIGKFYFLTSPRTKFRKEQLRQKPKEDIQSMVMSH